MKLSKYVMVNGGLFVAGILFLLLSPLSIVFNILSLGSFGGAFLMLWYVQLRFYKVFKENIDVQKEELILEMATEEGGEAYVYNKDKSLKRQNKKVNEFLKEKKFSMIATFILGIAFVYFAVRLIIVSL